MDENNNLYEGESFGKDGGNFSESAAPVAVKKKKRGITIFLIAILVLALGAALIYFLLPKTATTLPEFSYEIQEGTVTITGYYGKNKDVIIPDTIDGFAVTSIGERAFNDSVLVYISGRPITKTSITSVTIPDSVTSIGDYAFYDCDSLTSVTIPDSVTSIGDYAFESCEGLTSVTIPDSVTSIGYNAFRDCTSLTSITIPDSVTSIGDYAFYSCPIENATMPASLISYIPEDKLKTVVISGGKSVSAAAFMDCDNLTSVTIGNSVTSIGDYAFYNCTSLTSVVVPDSVTSIGENAFRNCTSLTSITIPDSVTSIGEDAFCDCTSLTSVNITDIASWCSISFYNYDANPLYYAKNLYLNGELVTELLIPDSVTSIGYFAFDGCASLTSVTIPDSVTSIGSYAFLECNRLTSVTIPDSVTSIGYSAFGGCEKLTIYCEAAEQPSGWSADWNPDGRPVVWNYIDGYLEWSENSSGEITITGYKGSPTELEIPYTVDGKYVTSIDNDAFYSCSSLTSIVIPESVVSIGVSAFSGCTSLTSLMIPESVTDIGEFAFYGCSSLESVVIPEGVCEIGVRTFSGCTGLTSVTIGNSVSSIGSTAFEGCTSLISVTIGNSVTSIGVSAFGGCASLTNIVIPDSVTSIGECAFAYCESLTSIVVPDSVTTIDYRAFYGCEKLTIYAEAAEQPSGWDANWNPDGRPVVWNYIDDYLEWSEDASGEITITGYKGSPTSLLIPDTIDGKTVTSVENHAFANCTSLESVVILNGVTSIGISAFYGCTALASIEIPKSVTTIDDSAFAECSALTSIVIPSSVTIIGLNAFYACDNLTIYAEAAEQPGGWNLDWNPDGRPVEWGYSADAQ